MIEIRHYDGQENLAEAVLAVMQSVYEQSPWTLEQIVSSMASQDEDYYLAYKGQELVGFWLFRRCWMRWKSCRLLSGLIFRGWESPVS